jgi:hypothetical protein
MSIFSPFHSLLNTFFPPPDPARLQTVGTDSKRVTFRSLSDSAQPETPGCFLSAAKGFENGALSHEQFLAITLAHLNDNQPARHPEDASAANLDVLSRTGQLGPVAAAIKLAMLYPITAPPAPDKPPVTAAELRQLLLECPAADTPAALGHRLAALSPLQYQIVVTTVLRHQNVHLATQLIEASNAPPIPSQFRIRYSALWPDGNGHWMFRTLPPSFWTAAVRGGWAAPSAGLALDSARYGPSAADLLRMILDEGLDVYEKMDPEAGRNWPIFHELCSLVASYQDNGELLGRILDARRGSKVPGDLLLAALKERPDGVSGPGAQMLKELLDRGAEVNWMDPRRPPTSAAALTSLAKDGNVDYAPESALHRAAKTGNTEAVQLLLERGAKIDIKDHFGQTPMQFARRAQRTDVIKLLEDWEARKAIIKKL